MRALLSLGSNIEPQKNLTAAVARLRQQFAVVAVSPAYRSAPWGRTDQAAFVNAAVALETELSPADLKAALRAIESDLGRVRDPADKNGPRTIDLDLSLCGDLVSDDPPLPDPDLARRWFVAVPLADIAPDTVVPGDGRPLAAIAASLAGKVDGEPVEWSIDEHRPTTQKPLDEVEGAGRESCE